MNYLFYGSFFLTCVALFRLGYQALIERRSQVKDRLELIGSMANTKLKEVAEEDLSFHERVIAPLYAEVLSQVGKLAPSSLKGHYNALLDASGLRGRFTYDNILVIQVLLAVFFVLMFYYFAPREYQADRPMYMMGLGVLALLFPYLVLRQKAMERREVIQNDLPSFLDLIYVSVEAGLSFDMAIRRTVDKLKGPLSDEFHRTLEEMRHGRARTDALKSLAARVQVEDVQTFITSIVQAEELGSNIGNVLRIQSATMRQAKKQRLEEKAAKIPIKMTFPLVLLMLPALFIVILGPAILNLMINFK